MDIVALLVITLCIMGIVAIILSNSNNGSPPSPLRPIRPSPQPKRSALPPTISRPQSK